MYNYWTILVGMVLCNFVANSLAVTVSLIVNTGGPENPGSGTFASINSAWDYIQDNLGSYVIQLSPQTHVIRANGKWNFSSSTVVMASASGRATLIAASMSVSLGSPAMVGTIGIEAGSLAMSTLDIIVPNMAEFSISNKNGSVTLSDVVASGSVPVKAEGQCTLAVLNVGSLAKMTVQGSTFQDMSMFMAAESGADMMIQTVNVTSCAQRGKQSTAGTSYTVIAGQGANKITIRDTKFSNCSHGGDNPDNGKIAGGFIGIFDSVQTDIEDIAFEACEAGGVGMIFLRNGIFNIDRGYFKGNMKGPTAVALYLLRIGTPQEGGLPTIAKFADLVFEENGKKINLPGSLLQIQTYNSDDTFEMSGITFLRNEAEACTDAWGTSGYLNPIVLSHVIMKDNICSNSGDTVDLTYEDWEVSGNWNNNQPFMLNDGGYWDGQLTLRRVHIRKQQMENFALECYGMGTIIIEDSLIEDCGGPHGIFYGLLTITDGRVLFRNTTIRSISSETDMLWHSPGIPDVYVEVVDCLFEDIKAEHSTTVFALTSGEGFVLQGSTFRRLGSGFKTGSAVPLTMTNCTMEDMTNPLHLSGPSSITDSYFLRNKTPFGRGVGGAIYFAPASDDTILSIANTVFNGNIAELGGGAIYVTTNSNSSLVLGDGVTFNHNYAARGGAIYVEGSPDSIRPPFIAFPSHVTFDSNGASDYGPSIASSLDKLLANGTISALFSGEVLEHLSVAPVDVYGQYFVPSLADSLLLTISLPNGDVFGSVTQYRAQSFIDFRRIVVTANPGEHMVVIKTEGTTSHFDPEIFQVGIPLTIKSCPETHEESFGQSSRYKSCVIPVCSLGCTKNGVCRSNFCHCNPFFEGVDCSMQGNKRDALLMKLADDDRSNAYGKRDEIMARIAATLQIAPSRVIFRSFVNASTNSLRRRDAANNSSFAISFSVLKEDNSYIEGNDLQLFQLKLTASGIASDVDYIPTEQRSIDARAVGPAIVLALSAFTACFATFLIVNLFYYRAHREVRKLAPIFSAQMIFGTIIACGLIFLYTWRPSEKICSAQVWMGGAAFSLVFGNIIGKNYRIHRIFRNRGKFVMTDTMVIPIPMTLLFGELVLDAIWTALSPLQPTLVDIGNTRYWTCSSDSNVSLIMTGVTFGYKLVLMGMAFALAYSTRRAYGGYAESKPVAMICYVTLAVAIVVLPVVLLQDISPETAFYLKAFGILTLNWFCLTTFFIFRSSKLRSTAWLTSSVVSSHTGISSGTQKTKNQLNHTAPMVLKSSTIDRSTDTPLDELVECSVLSDGLMGEHWLTRHLVINPAMALLSLQPVDSGLGTTYKLKAEVQIHSEPNDHRFVLQFPKEAVAIKIKKTRAFEKVTQIIAEIVGQDAPAPPE